MSLLFRDIGGASPTPAGSVVCIGAFDGLHRGHQALIGRARARARELGLPLSTLPDGIADQIASATYRALAPGGAFLVYQFTSFTAQLIQPYFDRIDRGMEAWNVPPAHLFWGWKSDADGKPPLGHH